MRRATALAVILWSVLSGLAHAEAPMTSLRPKVNPGFASLPVVTTPTVSSGALRPRPRPVASTVVLPPVATVTTENVARPGALRPRSRPVVPMVALPSVTTVTTENVAPPGMFRPRPRPAGLAPAVTPAPVAQANAGRLRPMPRPADLATRPVEPVVETAAASAPTATAAPRKGDGFFGGLFGGNRKPPRSTAPVAGSICGDPAIRGEDVARITSKVRGCGVEEPVRVTAIDGIRLNSPATIDCNTARALRTWIDEGLRPSFRGKEIVELRIAASYICRPRNNIKGNRISEHGRGKAVDVAGVVFSDGTLLTVSDNYPKLRRAHKAACGIFGTTLGPGSDGYHEDHLHFDTAGYRSGPYCR